MPPQDLPRTVRLLEVEPELAGQRIDNFLASVLKGVPKDHIYRLLRRGEVRVNRGRIRPGYRTQPGDLVRIPPVRVRPPTTPARTSASLLERLRAAIVLEREELLVLDKPAGLAVHGGSGIRWGAIEALRALRPEARHLELVHRLDRETSGCLLVAKSRPALRRLAAAFREGGVAKRYLALTAGIWAETTRVVDAPLSRFVARGGERLVQVAASGRASQTAFERLAGYEHCTLVTAEPLTGRTHQIRVHAAHVGHPLAGDTRYGDAGLNRTLALVGLRRLFLHAVSISLELDGERLSVETPLAGDLRTVLERLEPAR